MRFRIFPIGSQKFFQNLIDTPFFTIHFRPWTYIGPPFLQAAHIFEQGSLLSSSVNLFGDKYLAAIILAQGVLGSFASLQQSLDNRARFLHLVWNSPSPPSSFGKVTVCQFTMCSFLYSTVDPHRKSSIALSMALYTLMGRAWHCVQEKNKSSCSRQELNFPPYQFAMNPCHYKVKSIPIPTLMEEGKAQITTQVICCIDSHLPAYISLPYATYIVRKVNMRLTQAHLLASKITEVIQDLNYGFTVLGISFCKKHKVASKEDVKTQSISGCFNFIPLLLFTHASDLSCQELHAWEE